MTNKQTDNLSGLWYLGGKSTSGSVGRWVSKLIPWDRQTIYVEPFAGMLGILLGRQPVKHELVNDLNGRLTNWWECIREEPDEMCRLWLHTPHCSQTFKQAVREMDCEDKLKRAWAFQVVVMMGMLHTDNEKDAYFAYFPQGGRPDYQFQIEWYERLSVRLRNVIIENRCAVELLEKLSDREAAVIYCDPPYPSTARTSGTYGESSLDYEALSEVLLLQKGQVAISGYGSEWDHLGWEKHTKQGHATAGRQTLAGDRRDVEHSLWCNYKQESTLFTQ